MLKLLKYYTAGVVCFFIDFLVTVVCAELVRMPLYWSHGVGWLVATLINFQLNRNWVFDIRSALLRRFSGFIVLAIIALSMSTALLHFLRQTLEIHFYLAKFLAMGFVSLLNYLILARFLFKPGVAAGKRK